MKTILKGFLPALILITVLLGFVWAQVSLDVQGCATCTNGRLFTFAGDVVGVGDINAQDDLTATDDITAGDDVTIGDDLIFSGSSPAISGDVSFSGGLYGAINTVTAADTLTSADCGRLTTVSAGIDTFQIVLPEASTVLGCSYRISYIGADAGALLDISPLDSDADGIEGGCTLAASVVTFSGTADADIGLTKATGLTGDTITLTSCGANMWCASACQGIWANN